MSEILFPRAEDRRALRLKLAALATVVATLFAAFAGYLGLSFIGAVGGDVTVSARVTSLGDSLGTNSLVKFRGLKVGRITTVNTTRDADGLYRINMTLAHDQVDQIPTKATARVLPGTIFGAEYVDLVAPMSPTTGVRTGAVFAADQSPETARLMDAVSSTQRILGAIDPATLDVALHQMAEAIDGKGENLGRFIERANTLVAAVEGAQPDLVADLTLLNRDLATFADIEPQLALTLKNSMPVAKTVSDRAKRIDALLKSSDVLLTNVGSFLVHYGPDLAAFLNAVAPTYSAFVGGIKPFTEILQGAVGVLRNGADAISRKAIQMHADFAFERSKNYTSDDCPRYGSIKGANCK